MEWVQFARVERVPRAGEIVHARDTWDGGGRRRRRRRGPARPLGRRAPTSSPPWATTTWGTAPPPSWPSAASSCTPPGGTMPSAVRSRSPTRAPSARSRSWASVRSRTATTDLPWERLADVDAVYFTGGDAEALRAARSGGNAGGHRSRARNPAPAPAWHSTRSCTAPTTRARAWWPARSSPRPRWWSRPTAPTAGATPRPTASTGAYRAAPPPAPAVDAYGCGDSFAAGLTYGLGRGDGADGALELAARCGAACLTGRGPYAAQLDAA